jgi:glucan 1,4-alpha-glucosidase
MKKSILFLLGISLCVITLAEQKNSISSPNGMITVSFYKNDNGNIGYEMFFKNKTVIKPSALGFKFIKPDLVLNQFDIIKIDSSSFDESWKPVWGEQSLIRNNYHELSISLKNNASGIIIIIVFRVYNEGIGFRYEFPEQQNLNHFIIADELTQFSMTGDHKTFWIPGDYDTNEYAYSTTKLSAIDANRGEASKEIAVRYIAGSNVVQTPLMMKTEEGLYINIHEAALVNYPAMDLMIDKATFQFHTQLVPDAFNNKAYLQTPAKTPWRTIIVSDKAADILNSRMVLNLNEPSKIADVSWIKPSKFVGVWWEMHVGIGTWDLAGGQSASAIITKRRHGANTANVKRYIDFAAKNGIEGVLVEGWNTGWEDWFGNWKEDVFDFVTPYSDFDIAELSAYAKSKGVKIIMHHETSGSVTNYERQMDTAYRLMKKYGYDAVKTGYVGKIIPRGEHHDGQWMVNHYIRVAKKTADYKIMVDMHEPVRPTGLQRTYPNWLACEAARGNEFNAWSVGNMPDHETILPFTRLMGGPMDYTPGIFKIKMSSYNPEKKEQVHTTLAKQLALYVTMYSPLQMAADLPENYEAHMDAFQFIKDVPVDWDESKVLDAEPGDYIVEARKGKGTQNWFIGAITDERARSLPVALDFLNKGIKYIATIYRDAADADWKNNPEAYVVEKFVVDTKTKLGLMLAPGGGTAISIMPATAEDLKKVKGYK